MVKHKPSTGPGFACGVAAKLHSVGTEERRSITNDPNRADDPEYVVRLVGQVIRVSLETVRFVKSLPAL